MLLLHVIAFECAPMAHSGPPLCTALIQLTTPSRLTASHTLKRHFHKIVSWRVHECSASPLHIHLCVPQYRCTSKPRLRQHLKAAVYGPREPPHQHCTAADLTAARGGFHSLPFRPFRPASVMFRHKQRQVMTSP